jgi:DNA-binding protein H-NS
VKKSYKQIIDEIESLKKQAEEIRQAEVQAVIARMREAIDFYGLSAADLGFSSTSQVSRSRSDSSERVPKYRDAHGNVWSGRGPRPKWLREAIAAGKKKEDFAIRS